MIRNVVVHMQGEQPFLADLHQMPTPADSALVCTNVRLAGGKKPTYIDHSESTFLIPLIHVRFVEVPPPAEPLPETARITAGTVAAADGHANFDTDLDLDEDFLRRVRDA
jgi:hypothetical protein